MQSTLCPQQMFLPAAVLPINRKGKKNSGTTLSQHVEAKSSLAAIQYGVDHNRVSICLPIYSELILHENNIYLIRNIFLVI